MFDLVFFATKICIDRRRRLEVMQWCYSGSAEWADDMVDTTFFLSLPWSRARTSYFYPFTYLGRPCTGNTGWENLACRLVQCNCDMFELLFLVHAIYSR
jgi:hypothetical protein